MMLHCVDTHRYERLNGAVVSRWWCRRSSVVFGWKHQAVGVITTSGVEQRCHAFTAPYISLFAPLSYHNPSKYIRGHGQGHTCLHTCLAVHVVFLEKTFSCHARKRCQSRERGGRETGKVELYADGSTRGLEVTHRPRKIRQRKHLNVHDVKLGNIHDPARGLRKS